MSNNESIGNKNGFWNKALVVAQIVGGLAAVGALAVALVMLGMAL